jgi:dephospho-CoA kinase
MPRRNKERKKIILGLTGSFGSGKTTVARIFSSLGAQVLDADRIAHSCILPGTQAYRKIINIFGTNILKKNGSINRKKLAGIVFHNGSLLEKLNKIIHPQVISAIKNQIKLSKKKLIVLDVPLLIESGLDRIVDKVVVVKASTAMQVRRVKNRSSLNKKQVLKRIKFQIPLRVKARLADFVIDNSGTIEKTRRQVGKIMEKLTPRAIK